MSRTTRVRDAAARSAPGLTQTLGGILLSSGAALLAPWAGLMLGGLVVLVVGVVQEGRRGVINGDSRPDQ